MRHSRSEQQIASLASRKVVLERNHVHNPGKPLVDASPGRTLVFRTWPSHEDARHRLLQPPHILPKAGQGGAGRRCGRTPVRPAHVRPAVLACLPLTTRRRGMLLMPFRTLPTCLSPFSRQHSNACYHFKGVTQGSPQQLHCTLLCPSSSLRTGKRCSAMSTRAVSVRQCAAAFPKKHCKALCTCSACLHQTSVTCIK